MAPVVAMFNDRLAESLPGSRLACMIPHRRLRLNARNPQNHHL